MLIKAFDAGLWVSSPATVNGRLVFVTSPSAGVVDLWSSDGTTAGTQRVMQLYNDGPTSLRLPVDPLFHAASDQRLLWCDANSELYSTDGTAQGTINLTQSISSDGPWRVFGITQFKGRTFFNGFRGGVTTPGVVELWSTDGTVAGSHMIHHFAGGANGLLNVAGDTMFFLRAKSVGDDRIVHHIMQTDGTAAGTRLVTTIDVDGGPSTGLIPMPDGSVVYSVHSRPNRLADYSETIWRAGGPFAEPVQLKSLETGLYFSAASQTIGNITFLLAFDAGSSPERCELWRTDGSGDGTVMVQDVSVPGATPLNVTLTEVDGKLVVTRPGGSTLVFDPETMKAPQGPAQGTLKLTDRVLRVLGTSGDDSIRIYRHTRDPLRFVVNINGLARSFAFADVRKILIHGYSGNDDIATSEVNGLVGLRTVIWGGAGNDTLCTGAGWDTVWGEAGDDLISTSRGNDVASGGTGADTIRASTGDDTISGNDGDDSLWGGAGRDLLAGGDGEDKIDGGIDVDVLFGQSVIDVFFSDNQSDGDPLDPDDILTSA